MRIGITLESLDPTWGGIGIYTEEIVRHLLRIDRANEYVLIYPGFGAARRLIGQYERKYKNVTEVETSLARIPVGTYWDQCVVPGVARKTRVDVLFNPFWSVPVVGKFGKVITMHAVEQHTLRNVFDLKRRIEWAFRDRLLLPSADAIISISKTMTGDLLTYTEIPERKIRTIYHGVSEKFCVFRDEEKTREAREEYLLPEKFLLFVGHLYPQKNLGNLLRAFHGLSKEVPHDLVVVGRRRWKYEEDLALIETLGLQERVQFLRYVPYQDLPILYNLASCFVLPSFYEGFGLVLVEAMACGCPVAASDTGALAEVGGGAALLFDPHDPDAIADSIRRLLNDEEVRTSCIAKGLERARDFTWDRCAAETLALFEEVCHKQ